MTTIKGVRNDSDTVLQSEDLQPCFVSTDDTGKLLVNVVQTGGVSLAMNSGNLSSSVQRICIASDDTNISAMKTAIDSLNTNIAAMKTALDTINTNIANLNSIMVDVHISASNRLRVLAQAL